MDHLVKSMRRRFGRPLHLHIRGRRSAVLFLDPPRPMARESWREREPRWHATTLRDPWGDPN